MEELYDHVSDPNEFTNLACDIEFSKLLESCRQDLQARIPDMGNSLLDQVPEGYGVKNDRIIKEGFVPLLELH